MKDKLRELAERLDVLAHAVTEANWSEFSMRVPVEPERDADCVLSQAAIELRYYAAILDAEGDGGAVLDEGLVLVPRGLLGAALGALSHRDHPATKTIENLRRYAHAPDHVGATHPARSGVVSDEDVRAACEIIGIPVSGDDPFIDGNDVRAALEHFAAIAQEKQS